ncbi:MAG: methyltransferase domain-containing protein [Candidatus Taylorbacteria bacterium]|nr:methyltransferase domain-containing protein [Candidatus Taylorbacteria bacterium]
MNQEKDWSEYYDFTRAKPPYALLTEALKYVKEKGYAVDIGGGALRDTRYLLNNSFYVTVIDNSPLLNDETAKIKNAKLHAEVFSFEDFDFPENKYDLASAMFALNFCNPIHFDEVFKKIKDSLKTGGVFCAQLFGDHDEWSHYTDKTYPNKDRIMKLLDDFEIISFKEKNPGEKEENDELMTSGHILQFIARK